MPAFVANGPDIPEHLIQAHEDGKVIFFCGAGISRPAGLKGFAGLVDDIYKALGATKNSIEAKACKAEQYDSALHQLERRYPGQREAVRAVLPKVLRPKWRKPGATETHQALLQLGTDRRGALKLVTTNFDHVFERAAKRLKQKLTSYSAPLLPIPKQSRWDGLVYLHGLLPTTPDTAALNRLILTSGDFGLAYLTERWAARFVSQLFTEYTVCFVGYSINDPVLRYMMDALAADELLGEITPDAYVFASYTDGNEQDAQEEWKAKGVIPLLYKVPTGTHDHSALHDTLKEWAETYRDGVHGKEMVITQHASTPPLTSTRSDFAVGRVLWALSDDLAAKHFAELKPVPPLEWLEPFSESQFYHVDLARFGITPTPSIDKKLAYSLINRPAPYALTANMDLVGAWRHECQWDGVMFQVARWLLRHLGNHELILWLARKGGLLNEQFKELVQRRLEELAKLEHQDTDEAKAELAQIRLASPDAIPGPLVKTLWRVVLIGKTKTVRHRMDLFGWLRRLKHEGVTTSSKREFRTLLAPCVELRPPYHKGDNTDEPIKPKRIKDLVDWELELAADHVHSTLIKRIEQEGLRPYLPELLDDVTLLLTDALDLSRELGGADDKSDLSYLNQPSVSKHRQNKGFRGWTALIELAREAWLETAQNNLGKAVRVAEIWWYTPYPIFKRLAMFAAAQGQLVEQSRAVGWLLEDDSWWLWSVETRREKFRLLVSLSPILNDDNRVVLEQAIITGPPREIFIEGLDSDELEWRTDHQVWRPLAKMRATGHALGTAAQEKLDMLSQKYPQWILAENEKDEFPFWSERARSIGGESAPPEFELAPEARADLVDWLRKNPSSERLHHQDGWRERCRDNISVAVGALSDLADQNEWLPDRWCEVLQVGSEDEYTQRSWDSIADVIVASPDGFVESVAHTLSAWVQAIAKSFEGREEVYLELCRRLLAMEHQDGVETEEPVLRAINHPIGHVTEALLRWWYRNDLKDGQGLLEAIKPIFTDLCDVQVDRYRHGRVLLAAHAIALFRVDQVWTTENLLPLFDWGQPGVEARVAWEGFLWSPRIYPPFLFAIKGPLLETAGHYDDLGEHSEQYASFLTFVALDPGNTFSKEELAAAIGSLPAEGLRECASTLSRAMDGSEDQRSEYWNNRVKPFIHDLWPKSLDLLTPEISESIAGVCVSAKDSFAEAVEEFQYWLLPMEQPDYPIHLLHEAELSSRFPNESLTYLDSLIGDAVQWIPAELQQCLDAIRQADPGLVNDRRHVRLIDIIRRRGVV
ncbi:MAG: hypothetical protein ACJAWL_001616 [Motiliproteus sp.]|jgi:hypothetical protein